MTTFALLLAAASAITPKSYPHPVVPQNAKPTVKPNDASTSRPAPTLTRAHFYRDSNGFAKDFDGAEQRGTTRKRGEEPNLGEVLAGLQEEGKNLSAIGAYQGLSMRPEQYHNDLRTQAVEVARRQSLGDDQVSPLTYEGGATFGMQRGWGQRMFFDQLAKAVPVSQLENVLKAKEFTAAVDHGMNSSFGLGMHGYYHDESVYLNTLDELEKKDHWSANELAAAGTWLEQKFNVDPDRLSEVRALRQAGNDESAGRASSPDTERGVQASRDTRERLFQEERAADAQWYSNAVDDYLGADRRWQHERGFDR